MKSVVSRRAHVEENVRLKKERKNKKRKVLKDEEDRWAGISIRRRRTSIMIVVKC